METTTKARRYLILRTTERAGAGSGTVLEIELGVCEWKNDRPHGLGMDDTALDALVWSECIYSDHPEWGALGETRMGRDEYMREIRQLRAFVKLAESVDRKLDRVKESAGVAGSLGAAALRFARAVGASGIVKRSPTDREGWHALDADMIAYVVDSVIYDFRKRFTPAESAAA